MSSAFRRLSSCLLAATACALVSQARAQSNSVSLPPVTVDAPKQRPRAAEHQRDTASHTTVVTRPAGGPVPSPTRTTTSGSNTGAGGGSLTVPNTAQATADIQRTPGGVEVVPDTAFKDGPANTVKDVLGWVPGVLIQTRWGPDGRLSIRGSGLSRSFGNRGINPFMDGIPISTADGLFDLFEIDPTAYRYVEVYKGANALRYGANSLGGAINFVMPTGRDASPFEVRFDAGSFGYLKTQTSSGGAYGPADYFITTSAQREDGYREHSKTDSERLNANFGYQ
ncbi:MAG: TonB-dependent receptor plug domain-containing protein, partial [Alphaproteobacteria bacterium]|nr:TonB-dependent receptor plug domain-containing protein [Alphaproteobacteria bacterium]